MLSANKTAVLGAFRTWKIGITTRIGTDAPANVIG